MAPECVFSPPFEITLPTPAPFSTDNSSFVVKAPYTAPVVSPRDIVCAAYIRFTSTVSPRRLEVVFSPSWCQLVQTNTSMHRAVSRLIDSLIVPAQSFPRHANNTPTKLTFFGTKKINWKSPCNPHTTFTRCHHHLR